MPLDPDTLALDGPDFLDAVADAEDALGHAINAAEYRRRAQQWRADRQALATSPDATR